MNDSIAKNALLPSGFEDLLPPAAEKESRAIASVMRLFSDYCYARVKPPMAEFEETMLGDGPGAALAPETFRVMDPISHKMLALRSDITAQMARIAQSRLKSEARPLRLSYANDVIRTKAGQQRTLRQFAQVGCELIGSDTVEADAEVAVLAVSALSVLGVKNISIDFALPRLVDLIFEAEKVGTDHRAAFKSALRSKDEAGLEKAGHAKTAAILKDLLKAGGMAGETLKNLEKVKLPKSARALIQRLKDIVAEVEKAVTELDLNEVSITIDPLETKGFDYHSGITFTLFSAGGAGELGRGGRYLLYQGGTEVASASGLTLYMDALRGHIGFEKQRSCLYIPKPESWTLIKNLQKEGWKVVRGMGEKDVPSGCTHIYKNGQIKEL